jgi:predicted nuclease with TOPRIM domain
VSVLTQEEVQKRKNDIQESLEIAKEKGLNIAYMFQHVQDYIDTIETLQQEKTRLYAGYKKRGMKINELFIQISELKKQLEPLQGKAALVVDMPENCESCPFICKNYDIEAWCYLRYLLGKYCTLSDKVKINGWKVTRDKNCPLRQF